jgi:hypothetical protein
MITIIACPFCGGESFEVGGWQSICKDCFRRWETEYTEKLKNEYTGGLLNGKKSKQQETET